MLCRCLTCREGTSLEGGKRLKEDTKVTDLLIILADSILLGNDGNHELKIIMERFKSIIEELSLSKELLDEINKDIKI